MGVSTSERMSENPYQARLEQTLPAVRQRVNRALERADRSGEVTVVAITKGHPVAAVEAAIAAGLREIGENRVGELERKVERIGRDTHVRWHMVGHLQRNKARRALPLFDLIHSVDSPRIARRLSSEAERAGMEVPALIQVNTSGEESKGGFTREDVPERLGEIAALPGLRIQGLMTMAPFTNDERVLREAFAGARNLFELCANTLTGFEARHLSMGMSNDFETAIEEGSTMVRLGTVLFGERER